MIKFSYEISKILKLDRSQENIINNLTLYLNIDFKLVKGNYLPPKLMH